jgi:hypothetical protein
MITINEEFSDKWSIATVPGGELYLNSLTISGSEGNDGRVASKNPINLVVTGAHWRVTMEFAAGFGGGQVRGPIAPIQNQIRRDVTFDLNDGLAKRFTVVYVLPNIPDVPVLLCKNLDPSTNPFAGAKNPYDFTYSADMLRDTGPTISAPGEGPTTASQPNPSPPSSETPNPPPAENA